MSHRVATAAIASRFLSCFVEKERTRVFVPEPAGRWRLETPTKLIKINIIQQIIYYNIRVYICWIRDGDSCMSHLMLRSLAIGWPRSFVAQGRPGKVKEPAAISPLALKLKVEVAVSSPAY